MYYLINPDSYFFHWAASRVMAGEGPPAGSSGANFALHSGSVHPLVYTAKALQSTFHLSSADSLKLACEFLPPTVAVISMLLLYFAVARLFNRRVAFFSALAWALLFYSAFMGVAGNNDRDAVSVLLMMVGAISFYSFKSWRFNVGARDVGWVIAAICVLLVQGLLYLQWGIEGAFMMFVVILTYFVFKYTLDCFSLPRSEPSMKRRLVLAAKKLNWRAFVLVAVVNLVVAGLYYHDLNILFLLIRGSLMGRFSYSAYASAEMLGMPFQGLFTFGFFLIPIVAGIYLALKQRNDALVFFTSWFISFVVLAFFSYRVVFLSVPAACVVSGAGMAYLWDMSRRVNAERWLKVGIPILLIVLVTVSWFSVAHLNAKGLAADRQWQGALAYLNESTPADAVVMSEWGRGYWILDVGQRRPFVDNGYYGWDITRLYDVGTAYSTSDPSKAAEVMAKNGVDYLVFGKQQLDMAKPILAWAFLDNSQNKFPDESLIVRSLKGEFVAGGGLEIVYKNDEVVILALSQPVLK